MPLQDQRGEGGHFTHTPAVLVPVAERQVGGVDQRLAALVEQQAGAHAVHGVAEGEARGGIGEAQRAAGADMAEGGAAQDHAVDILAEQLAPTLRLRLSIDFMKPSAKRVGMRKVASSCVAIETSPMRASVLRIDQLAAAVRERRIHAGKPARVGDAVGRTDLGGMAARLLAPPVRQAPTLKKNSEAGELRVVARSTMKGVSASLAL